MIIMFARLIVRNSLIVSNGKEGDISYIIMVYLLDIYIKEIICFTSTFFEPLHQHFILVEVISFPAKVPSNTLVLILSVNYRFRYF